VQTARYLDTIAGVAMALGRKNAKSANSLVEPTLGVSGNCRYDCGATSQKKRMVLRSFSILAAGQELPYILTTHFP